MRTTLLAFLLLLAANVSSAEQVNPTSNNQKVGGTIDPTQGAWHAKYKKQQNVPDPAKTLLNTDPEPKLTKGFESLYNGKDLTGWTPQGGTCKFVADGECIVGTCIPGSPSTYLSTTNSNYTDFIFTCDMRWDVDGNSGVMFRAKTKEGKKGEVVVYGPQAEMEGFEKDRGWSGGIYGQSCGGFFYPLWLKEHARARTALKPNQWNRITISARGNVVKTWVNGIPAAYWMDDGSYPQGFFALQIHKGQSGTVRFKGIRVKNLAK